MKRIILTLTLIGMALCAHAQCDTVPDTTQSCKPRFSLTLGVAGGASLLFGGNSQSPYYSKYGFTLHLPLMARWDLAPHWRFGAGLRYDFTWNPLYYNVAFSGTHSNGDDRGLQFLQTPTTATQKAHTFTSHLGLPVELTWYPMAHNKKALGLTLDLFVGYAVVRYITIDNIPTPGTGERNYGLERIHSTAIQPWKVEVGLTLSTDLIGLTHGVRLFTNLLPTYQDPATGDKIYTSGITLFL